MRLPETFLEQMKLLLGTDYDAWLESYEKKPYAGLRVNRSKIEPDEWENNLSPFELRRVLWTKNGYYISEEAKASRHPYYYDGLCVRLPAEKARNLVQNFRAKDFWFPTISAIPGQKRC